MASATAFCPLCWAIWVPAAPRLESSVSSPEICWFSLASTPMAGAIVLIPVGDGVAAPVELVGQVRDGRQGVVDGRLPAGERAHTVVDGGQEGPDRRLVAVEGVVELADDGLQLVDPATVEDEGQGAEGVLDARSVARRRLRGCARPGPRNLPLSSSAAAVDSVAGACKRTYSSPSGSSKRTWAVVPTGRRTDFLMSRVRSAWKSWVEIALTCADHLGADADLGVDRAG